MNERYTTMLLVTLLIAALLYLVAIHAAAFLLIPSLLARPDRDDTPSWGWRWDGTDLRQDGSGTRGWAVVRHALDAPWVVYLPGNAYRVQQAPDLLDRLSHELKCNVLGVNYAATGLTPEPPPRSATHLAAPALAAVRFLKAKGAKSVTVFGHSLGGAVGRVVKAQHPDVRLVVDRSFASLAQTAERILGLKPMRYLVPLLGWEFPQDVEADVALYHDGDEIIPTDCQLRKGRVATRLTGGTSAHNDPLTSFSEWRDVRRSLQGRRTGLHTIHDL